MSATDTKPSALPKLTLFVLVVMYLRQPCPKCKLPHPKISDRIAFSDPILVENIKIQKNESKKTTGINDSTEINIEVKKKRVKVLKSNFLNSCDPLNF